MTETSVAEDYILQYVLYFSSENTLPKHPAGIQCCFKLTHLAGLWLIEAGLTDGVSWWPNWWNNSLYDAQLMNSWSPSENQLEVMKIQRKPA